MDNDLLKQIPKTDTLLSGPRLQEACRRYPYAFVKEAVQEVQSELRQAIMEGTLVDPPSLAEAEDMALARLARQEQYHLKRVVNATGVVLHTNLGRAPLGAEAAGRIARIAANYCNLEYDLESGGRGSRYAHIEDVVCRLTGAEAAMVVNNNAAAVFLMLNTLAKGCKVAISRGELVEIGGSFRIPEIMEQSGAELIEVGATNKTHAADYEKAIHEQGADLLLKVHTSNFAMTGFTGEVELAELVRLGHENGRPVLYDAGAAFLFPPEMLGLHEGTVIRKCLQTGVDMVCFSGDKLLGSAQAGILAGRREYIERMRRNHLNRMLRVDKLTLAALEASLQYYCDPELAKERIPILAMASMTAEQCREAAEDLQERLLAAAPGLKADIVAVEDEMGGGSLPGLTMPGFALRLEIPGMSATELEAALRAHSVPIVARVFREATLLSLRTLTDGDAEEIVAALAALSHKGEGGREPA